MDSRPHPPLYLAARLDSFAEALEVAVLRPSANDSHTRCSPQFERRFSRPAAALGLRAASPRVRAPAETLRSSAPAQPRGRKSPRPVTDVLQGGTRALGQGPYRAGTGRSPDAFTIRAWAGPSAGPFSHISADSGENIKASPFPVTI